MKTVLTIVLDEDKQCYGWRLDRNESEEVLKELSNKLIESTDNSKSDTLEKNEPIPDLMDICLFNLIIPEIKEQMKPYKLHCPYDGTLEVL